MKRCVYIIPLMIGLFICSGCSPHLRIQGRLAMPAGVDSLIAVRADSITARLYVQEKNKQEASRMYHVAAYHYDRAESLWVDLQQLEQPAAPENTRADKSHTEKRIHVIHEHITTAEQAAVKARRLNPFDYNIPSLLARIYYLHGSISGATDFFRQSIDHLISIIKREKGEHVLYFRLGECYYQLQEWAKAYENYQRAEQVLLATAWMQPMPGGQQSAGRDSVDHRILFRYIYHQAIASAKQYDNKNALTLFARAKTYAISHADSELVDNYISWIQWDGGNIATAEMKSKLLQLLKQEKYEEAKNGFEQLIGKLHTQSAKDEINWRIACIEYEFLDQKEAACQRMQEIVRRLSDQSVISGQNVTEEYRQYATDAGTMFYKLGIEYKRKSRYKKALRCFSTAADIEWYGKEKSLLELAKLSIHNPEQTLNIVNQILEDENDLSLPDKLHVYTLKLNALKRFGRNRLTEIQETYRKIKSLQ